MKYHLNQEYQIYLDDELFENRDQNYVLTNFQKALLKKEFFKTNQIPLDNTVMPKGVFGDALNDYLNEEREKNHQFLMNLGIKRSDIFQIELRDDINKVEQIGSSSWLAPSLTLSLAPGHTVHIVGLLENITEQGFLVLNRHSLDNIWCLWPSLLAATIVNSTLNKPFSPALHFLSSSKSIYYNIEKPIEELQSFVSFYSIYSKNFCPILPEWLSTMANDPVEKIQSKIKADLQSEHFYNSYAKSIFNSRELPEKNELEMWSIWLKKQFSQSLNSMGLFK
ncbi:MAG: hypothetical protein S4CHLAM7_10620 [Chlamydiae bacterium]|nr:hypothetical protein [Chlamydiota bacterium]